MNISIISILFSLTFAEIDEFNKNNLRSYRLQYNKSQNIKRFEDWKRDCFKKVVLMKEHLFSKQYIAFQKSKCQLQFKKFTKKCDFTSDNCFQLGLTIYD
jgi:hypothetical protein